MGRAKEEFITALLDSNCSVQDVQKSLNIVNSTDEVSKILENPSVPKEEKVSAIEKLFPSSVCDVILEIAQEGLLGQFESIAKEFIVEADKRDNIAHATVYYVTKPSDEQIEGLKKFVCKETGAGSAVLELEQDESLIGGFIIQIGNRQYDRSIKSKIESIKEKVQQDVVKEQNVSPKDVIAVLKSDIKDYEFIASDEEIGTVIRVGDGIARITGLSHAMYGEIIVFENGVKAMVQDIKKSSIGCILFGSDEGISEGSKVKRTHKKAGVPVGDGFIGRVVDALGEPIDGLGDIKSDDYRLIEQPAPSIVDRKSVSVPLETGILSIDSMFPIGRGQRELIIGDRQTGKTSIALDTILNQKGKNCICVYCAIGQKASTVAKLVGTLKKHGALEYTIVLCSTASDESSLQYIAPYSATAMAEYFMYQGKDCLIVYDDLSKHAVAYRAISLLLERSPGREAYPGDVFYLHSRLLERSSRLSEKLGGGSITALPIIETQAGDVSAYIPTNVISITDGQIFLESDLFFAGQRPAVNVGLSVSRVGGAAQTKAMKKAAGSLRVDLAQYREMEVFTQFASDLDQETKNQLDYGRGLMEILKQPLEHPMALADQVITLVAAIGKKFMGMPFDKIKPYQVAMLDYFNENHSEVVSEINSQKILDDQLKQSILDIADEFANKQ